MKMSSDMKNPAAENRSRVLGKIRKIFDYRIKFPSSSYRN